MVERRWALAALGAAALTAWWMEHAASAQAPPANANAPSVQEAPPAEGPTRDAAAPRPAEGDEPAKDDKPAKNEPTSDKPAAEKPPAGDAPVKTVEAPVETAAPPAKTQNWDVEALQAAVTQSGERFVQAFNDRDSRSIAALFTEEAEFVDGRGVVFHGKEPIEIEYDALFETAPEGELELFVTSIRPIAPTVVVEEGVSTLRPADDGAEIEVRYVATHVKQPDGKWLMASLRELSDPVVSPRGRLNALAWLEGKWREELGPNLITTEWKRTEDGNFLLGEFVVKNGRDVVRRGTHRVGWDAVRKQFRSWVFDSEGGFVEGGWTVGDDGLWSVQLEGGDASGDRRSMLVTFARESEDAIVITQEKRWHGDEPLPDASHRIVRQPPALDRRIGRLDRGQEAAPTPKQEAAAPATETPEGPATGAAGE